MRCCNCSCFRVNDEFSRVNSCYPSNDSPQPIESRLQDLTNWVESDNSRISTISDILLNRIKLDINKKQINSTKVGLKILIFLSKSKSIPTSEIIQNLTSLVCFMINTQNKSFLQIAKEVIRPLIQNADHTVLKNLVMNIIHVYIRNLSNLELNPVIYYSISSLIDQCSINFIPLESILPLISNHLINFHTNFTHTKLNDTEISQKGNDDLENSDDGIEKIVISIAHSITPVFLIQFFESWIEFLNTHHLWNEINFIEMFMLLLCKEMNDKCAPSFFKLWLDQLPPRSPDSGHCRTIVIVASYLLINSEAQFQTLSNKLLSQTELDHSLMTLFLFYLYLPKLMYEDSNMLFDLLLQLSQKVAIEISQYEMVRIAYVQIYSALPIISDDQSDYVNYDPVYISLVFRFLTMFNKAIGAALTRKMLNGCLKRLYFFLIRFIGHHQESTLASVIEYLNSISTDIIYRSAASECVIPFLLALQNGLKKIVANEGTSLADQKSDKNHEMANIDEKRRSFSSSSFFLNFGNQPKIGNDRPVRRKHSLSKNNSFLSPLIIHHSKTGEKITVVSILELHTLIICSMIDSVQNLSKDVKEYVMSIYQQRAEHRPALILNASKESQISNAIDLANYNEKLDFFERNQFPYLDNKILLETIIGNDGEQMESISQLIETIPDEEFLVSENIDSEVSYASESSHSANPKHHENNSLDSSYNDSQLSLSDET